MEQRGEGWITFAAIILFLGGIMKVFDAIWAFSYHGAVQYNLQGAVFGHTLKTYGWIDLVVAVILILCAAAVMGGSEVGRWVGIVAAVIAAIDAIWWMPFYPIWGFTYIVLGVLVIYGLAVYGGKSTPSLAE